MSAESALKLHQNLLLLRSPSEDTRPSVYDFSEYVAFIRSAISHRGSVRAWAKRFGFASHSHLLLILKGERKLPLERLASIASALKLSDNEKRYFETLVRWCDCADSQEKTQLWNRLHAIRTREQFEAIRKAELELLGDWQFLLTFEILRNFTQPVSAEGIQNQFIDPPDLSVIQSALNILLKLGFADKVGNGFVASKQVIFRTDKIPSETTFKLHRGSANAAVAALTNPPSAADRKFVSTSLTLSPEAIERLKVMIDEWNSQALNQEKPEAESRKVVQFNLHLFPVSQDFNPKKTRGGAQ
jgi:uncharacterized protein (TIGR02147 family)